MIWCVTLNPSLDVTYRLRERFVPGTISLADTMDARLGGKGNNVARTVQLLGQPVTVVGVFGGATGAELKGRAENLGIPVVSESVPDDARICITVISGDGAITELRPPGPWVTKHTADRLLSEVERGVLPGDWITISGSLPPGLEPSVYSEWIDALKSKTAGIIVDCGGEALSLSVAAQPTAVVPNQEEFLAAFCGKPPSSVGTHYIVTGGADGVTWWPPGQGKRRWIPGPVAVVNSVGAGDTFLGALVSQIVVGKSWEDAIPWATAAATASVETVGVAVLDPSRIALHLAKIQEARLC